MRPPKYPLEPLERLRDEKVDEATRALATAVAARDEAERRRRGAEKTSEDHEDAARALREKERAALERGELTAGDLMRADAWEARVAEERATLARGVEQAREAESRARASEAGAQGEVAARKSEAQVVAKDRARWEERARKRADDREEQSAEEAWRPRGRDSGPRGR
jgi:hypothetical protein